MATNIPYDMKKILSFFPLPPPRRSCFQSGLFVYLSPRLQKNYWLDFHETGRKNVAWTREEPKFWSGSESFAGYKNCFSLFAEQVGFGYGFHIAGFCVNSDKILYIKQIPAAWYGEQLRETESNVIWSLLEMNDKYQTNNNIGPIMTL